MNRKFIDMTQGSLLKNIIRFAIPVILSSVLQQLYTAADMIVIGQFSGSEELASVGATSAITSLLLTLFVGLSTGVSVVASRYFGAKNAEGMHRTVHTAISVGIISGMTGLVLGLTFCRPLLQAVGTPEGPVMEGAVRYLQIMFIGKPAALMYNFGAAIVRSTGDTKRPLYILTFTGAVNVVLNLILVTVFHLGVEGVAIATSVASWLNLILILRILLVPGEIYSLEWKKLKIYKQEIKDILSIGVPAGLQSSLMGLSNVFIQSAVNTFGPAAISGNTAAGNLESFVLSIKTGFAQATVTAVSQNYGAKNEARIKKSRNISLLCMLVGGAFLGLLLTTFSEFFLGFYISDSAEALAFGQIRTSVCTLLYFLSGIWDVLAAYLRGIGYSSSSAIIALVGIGGFRIFWVTFIFPLFPDSFAWLYVVWPLSWSLVILMHWITISLVQKKALEKMHARA